MKKSLAGGQANAGDAAAGGGEEDDAPKKIFFGSSDRTLLAGVAKMARSLESTAARMRCGRHVETGDLLDAIKQAVGRLPSERARARSARRRAVAEADVAVGDALHRACVECRDAVMDFLSSGNFSDFLESVEESLRLANITLAQKRSTYTIDAQTWTLVRRRRTTRSDAAKEIESQSFRAEPQSFR